MGADFECQTEGARPPARPGSAGLSALGCLRERRVPKSLQRFLPGAPRRCCPVRARSPRRRASGGHAPARLRQRQARQDVKTGTPRPCQDLAHAEVRRAGTPPGLARGAREDRMAAPHTRGRSGTPCTMSSSPTSRQQRHEGRVRSQYPGPHDATRRLCPPRQLQDEDLLQLQRPRSLLGFDPLSSRVRRRIQ